MALPFFRMSSIGSGYDLSVDTFSPDGRIFQVCKFEQFLIIVLITLCIGGICNESHRERLDHHRTTMQGRRHSRHRKVDLFSAPCPGR